MERQVIPRILELFEKRNIHATWATVGLLFSDQKPDILKVLPSIRPAYDNDKLSPYPYIESGVWGDDEQSDPMHYGKSIVSMIRETKHQTVASHTFSHYYCMEKGQTKDQFKADLMAAVQIADRHGIKLNSLVFPRNQCNEDYLPLLGELGITAYRGNPAHSLYHQGYSTEDPFYKRIFRLIDTYLNMTGFHCYSLDQVRKQASVNLPASHFLRPYSKRLKAVDRFRLKRIRDAMSYAAKHGLVYHLWWHPYNFASHPVENLTFLEAVIDHYEHLRAKYGMESMNMEELQEEVWGRSRTLRKTYAR